MVKILILMAACFGAYWASKLYLPSAWAQGFTFQGYFISGGIMLVGLIGWLAWKGK